MKYVYTLFRRYGLRGVWLSGAIKLNKTRRLAVPGLAHPLHLRPSTTDVATFHQIFTLAEYDIDLPFIPKHIIDAGANIGLASVFFSNKYPSSQILSIEPESSNFKLLEENTRKYPNIIPINKALSNTGGLLDVHDAGVGNWGYYTSRRSSDENHDDKIRTIVAVTIADIMDRYKIEILDLVKIDIEGHEKELFQSNFESWIPKTKCIIIELHDRYVEGCSTSIFNCIRKYNFSFSICGENVVLVNKDLVRSPPGHA